MRKILFFCFCIAICVFGFLAFTSLNKPTPKPVQKQAEVVAPVPAFKEEEMVSVFIARKPIASGTFISKQHVRKTRVPVSSDAAINGFTTFSSFNGSVATEEVKPGDLLEAAHLVAPNESGFMAVAIRQGYRGISIPIWREATSVAIYRPGDVVDLALVATFPDRNEFTAYQELNGKRTPALLKDIAATMLTQGARILAVDNSNAAQLDAEKDSSFSTQIPMVLEINNEDAEKVALAAGVGKIMLFMRGEAASNLSTDTHVTAEELFPAYKNLGPTRGTTIMRGSMKDVEGYPMTENAKPEKEEKENSEKQGKKENE